MNKYSILVSIITLILGFTFYGEFFSFNIGPNYYHIAGEVIFFTIWLVIMLIFLLMRLKKFILKT